jgi:hypothetical protein
MSDTEDHHTKNIPSTRQTAPKGPLRVQRKGQKTQNAHRVFSTKVQATTDRKTQANIAATHAMVTPVTPQLSTPDRKPRRSHFWE